MYKFKIQDKEINYKVVYREVKYPRLEFKTGDLLLVLPKNFRNIQTLLEKHKSWIYKKHIQISSALKDGRRKKLILNRDTDSFKEYVYNRLNEYSRELNLSIGKVFFRSMKTKWASCSLQGNITVNLLLKYLPAELIDYVLFHEVAHLRERKHNKNFWNFVKKKFNDYPEREKDLMIYWFLIQKNQKY